MLSARKRAIQLVFIVTLGVGAGLLARGQGLTTQAIIAAGVLAALSAMLAQQTIP